MADGLGRQPIMADNIFSEGDILVWRLEAASREAAKSQALALTEQATHLGLGRIHCSPAGLDEGTIWLDLILEREVEEALINHLLGRPEVY